MMTKTKSNYHIELSEAKKHLRIDNDFIDDDDYLTSLIKSAVEICENYIEKDIAITDNLLKLNDYSGIDIIITEGNLIDITGITINEIPINITDCKIKQYRDYFIIELPEYHNGELTVNFKTGYVDLPNSIKSAILITLGDLYDVDRSNYTFSNYKNNAVSERLLNFYKAIYFKHYNN